MIGNNNEYLILYANCIPVKGVSRSTICDLQRNQYWYIPNDLYEILIDYKKISLNKIKEIYMNQNDIIDEYIDFLIGNELGFIGSSVDLDNFPSISLEWDDPSIITNSIIDSNKNSNHVYGNILNQLEQLGCKYLQLRFFDEIKLSNIDAILSNLQGSRIISVEIILPFINDISDELDSLIKKHSRITQILFFGADSRSINDSNSTRIVYILEKINSEQHCGLISPNLFSINIKNFTESVKNNSCLNRKISVDQSGEIKNCPSMIKSYGNIKEKSFADAILTEDFKAIWSINKDKINTCSECEFRYICTDCRAYIENPLDLYSKPLKCGYDPLLCQWSEWSNNPLKQTAIKHYETHL